MIADLLDKTAKWYRPAKGVDASNCEYLGDDALVCGSVACSIQPASAKEVTFYSAFRSLEISHSIYTDNVGPWERNDALVYAGRRLVVVGVRDLLERGQVIVLDALEYKGANQRQ